MMPVRVRSNGEFYPLAMHPQGLGEELLESNGLDPDSPPRNDGRHVRRGSPPRNNGRHEGQRTGSDVAAVATWWFKPALTWLPSLRGGSNRFCRG